MDIASKNTEEFEEGDKKVGNGTEVKPDKANNGTEVKTDIVKNGSSEVKREGEDYKNRKCDLKEGIKRSIGDEESDDDTPVYKQSVKQPKVEFSHQCPYLDTIDRGVLDFDFEKLCSVSLSRINVYACLICGKYFQGRGNNTHAYTHSVSENHRVFLNLETKKFYCLPDNYEVIDASLSDILYVLNPTFTPELIKKLETSSREARAYDGTMYTPGVVGLNNIKANDYLNVILQAMSHVEGLRYAPVDHSCRY